LSSPYINQPIRPARENKDLSKEFYFYSLKDILWVSKIFMQLLGRFSKGLNSVGVDYPIWQMEEEDMLILCSDFPDVEKSQALKQFKKIKKLNGSFGQDLEDQSAEGIGAARQRFSEKVKTIEIIIQRIHADIKASKFSPGAEKYAAFIGEFNSGNISPASGGGSSESSPAKAGSEDDAASASENNAPESPGTSH
jgi:hypothetical protein